jgi:DNA-binding MarR family transcriptional regulator
MSTRPPRTVPQPRALRPDRANAGTLLLEAYRRFERELFDELHRAGHAGLRPKHGAVLANVDREGTRATELAVRAGMTKASMGELVDELEALGYVRRAGDLLDRRAKRVVPTADGLEVARLARAAIEGLERRWAARVGERRFRALLAALEALASAPP